MIKYNYFLNNLKLSYIQKKKKITILYNRKLLKLLNLLLDINYIQNFFISGNKIIIIMHNNMKKKIKIYYKSSKLTYIKFSLLTREMIKNLGITLIFLDRGTVTTKINNFENNILICIIF
jgi:hypothetical protein